MKKIFGLFLLFIILSSPVILADSKYPDVVVVTSQHYASSVGAMIIKQGGNIADAAVAIAYALAVVHPSCGNLFGGGFALVHMNGRSKIIDFREVAPNHLTGKVWRQSDRSTQDFLSIAVPGTVAGINTLHQRYARLPLSVDLQPAIDLAENGYVLKSGDLFFINQGYNRKNFSVAAQRQFSIANAHLHAGDKLVQPDLANVLRLIAKKGNGGFYTGPVAQRVIHYIQTNGGVMSLDDLKRYQAKVVTPLVCSYRGFKVIATPPPSRGGFILCQMLHDFSINHTSSQKSFFSKDVVLSNIKSMRQSFATASRYIGNPSYSSYKVQQLLHQMKKSQTHVWRKPDLESEKLHTTSFVIADEHGNAISITYTLNDFFGSGKMAPDTGFFLNDGIKDFNLNSNKSQINQLKPGNAPVSSMNPVMIFNNNRLFLALGTPGGLTIPSQEALVIEGVVDYGWSLRKALSQPRYYSRGQNIYLERSASRSLENRFSKWFPSKLRLGSHYGSDAWGGVTIIKMDAHGHLSGAIDPRRTAGSAVAITGDYRL